MQNIEPKSKVTDKNLQKEGYMEEWNFEEFKKI